MSGWGTSVALATPGQGRRARWPIRVGGERGSEGVPARRWTLGSGFALGMRPFVGRVFCTDVTLSEADIASFARSCGDANPLHHAPELAARTRFGGIIACGPQYASLLRGLAATHFSREGAMLGLEFTFRFQKPVRPGERLELRWEVVEVTPKSCASSPVGQASFATAMRS